MKIYSVTDPEFKEYGKVINDLELELFLNVLGDQEKPDDAVVYVPSVPELEVLNVRKELQDRVYGGMPIQIGYCNGYNTKLNCLEYHRDSEINIPVDDAILLLAKQSEIDYDEQTLDTSKVKAFRIPAGTAVEIYATSLHYAPCNGEAGKGFQVAVVLPKGTNTEKPDLGKRKGEAKWLTACNKWLLAHPEAGEAKDTPARLTGINLDIAEDLK